MNNEILSRYILPTIEEKTAYGTKHLDPYTKLFQDWKDVTRNYFLCAIEFVDH